MRNYFSADPNADTGASECIDVIIPAWNSAATIERAILSVLNEAVVQSVIVVDDGSSDDTAARTRALAIHAPRLRVLSAGSNRGPSAARNLALQVAAAPWVALLDSDDFMRPGRLTTLLLAAGDHDFVADEIELLADDHSPDAICDTLLHLREASLELDLRTFVLGNITRRGHIRREMGFLKLLMRRAFLDRHGLRYDETVRLGEDYLLYARALGYRARFRVIPACGYVAVSRPDSLSGKHTRQNLDNMRAADRALLCLPGLSRKELAALRAHIRQQDCKIQWLEMIEAVKSGNLSRMIRGFSASPPVATFVAGKLAEQCVRRLSIARWPMDPLPLRHR